jgi:hypothetical protein
MITSANTPAIAPENKNNSNPIAKEENAMKKTVYNIDKTIDTSVCKSIRNIAKSISKSKDIFYSNGNMIRKMVDAGLDEAMKSFLNGSDLVRYDGRLITAVAFEGIIDEYNKLVELKNAAEEDLKELEEELAKYEF